MLAVISQVNYTLSTFFPIFLLSLRLIIRSSDILILSQSLHDLHDNSRITWTSQRSNIFWPVLLLPPILDEERARTLVYEYDADCTSFTDGVSKDKIHKHAEHLSLRNLLCISQSTNALNLLLSHVTSSSYCSHLSFVLSHCFISCLSATLSYWHKTKNRPQAQ